MSKRIRYRKGRDGQFVFRHGYQLYGPGYGITAMSLAVSALSRANKGAAGSKAHCDRLLHNQ